MTKPPSDSTAESSEIENDENVRYLFECLNLSYILF